MPFQVSSGSPLPYGAKCTPEGVNFSLYIEDSIDAHLVLMHPETLEVWEKIAIHYQTGKIKHLFIEELKPPFAYAYQTSTSGDALLLDPYAKAVQSPHKWNAKGPYRPAGLVLSPSIFEWENDQPLNIAKEDLVIYEMHVRGFTRDSSSGVPNPGGFLGVIEKIPHLKNLGITAVELMPVQEFNEKEYYPLNPAYQDKLFQYWGYSTVQFFSPMNRYAPLADLSGSLRNFKEMVKQLHRAGIEVILDMVLNHSSEGNERGPIQSFKGLAKETYYILESSKEHTNFSGCGNTLNCNHPIVTEWILDVLRYWVQEMHVDGFRFDLATIFYRGEDGKPLAAPPILEAITKDPLLSQTKLIAEPWDAAGMYRVGSFYSESVRWSEWNGHFRDCVRCFIKGDKGLKGEFATRISGSEDLYGHDGRFPRNSVNFITCHDGFTLRDLVSYNRKHNMNNGENNRDGTNQNYSWNCGEEGPSTSQEILALRERQMRNFHLALMISQGIPMLFMGDEYGHTKFGNNNSWCQDNPLNWFLWEELIKNGAFMRFYKGLIRFRLSHPILRRKKFLRDDDIQWHGKIPLEPAWDIEDQFVAFTLIDKASDNDMYAAFNASRGRIQITLPPREDKKAWYWIVNTARISPQDFREESDRIKVNDSGILMESYSSILLKAL